MTSSQSRDYLEKLRENPAFGMNGFDLDELREIMAVRHEPEEVDIRCLPVDIDGIPGEWVISDGVDPDLRLLYLHGGGYISGSGAFYLILAAHLSRAAQCAVLLPDYRLAPEYPFPAALEDCTRIAGWIRHNGPAGPASARSTFIAGDSAGGGLTLATLLNLRDREQPLPQGGIALSPFADLTLTGDSIRSEGDLDPIMHPNCLPDFVSRYLGETDPRHPLASPAYGDYHAIPPLLIQVGEHEIIRDDSVRTAQKASADGVDVKLEIWEGMFHVFQSHDPLLPEAEEAIAHIASFMQNLSG